jgi:hypothetical protein
MTRSRLIVVSILCALSAATANAAEPPAASTDGKPILEARLRHESVVDDAFARDADATTLRLRVGYRTPVVSGWSGLIELENTSHLSGEHFNSSANGHTHYPTIADPDNTTIDQAYVHYAPSAATRFTLGRQVLVYDNQRFFGNSGWRQNQQTFDALDMEHTFDGGLALRYSYLNRVERVFGEQNPTPSLARWMLHGHLLRASYPGGPGALIGYAHFIENRTLPLTSHRNAGLRYAAKHDAPDDVGWLANLEYARQSPYSNGSHAIHASYTLAEGGLVWKGNTFKAGWERLGGNGHYAFQTPFATLHIFDGWADKFLTTPVSGLDDTYLSWNRGFGKLTATIAAHDFHSDHASIHYGREWDASLSWAFAPHWTALAKFADYHAVKFARDTAKTWLSIEYSY